MGIAPSSLRLLALLFSLLAIALAAIDHSARLAAQVPSPGPPGSPAVLQPRYESVQSLGSTPFALGGAGCLARTCDLGLVVEGAPGDLFDLQIPANLNSDLCCGIPEVPQSGVPYKIQWATRCDASCAGGIVIRKNRLLGSSGAFLRLGPAPAGARYLKVTELCPNGDKVDFAALPGRFDLFGPPPFLLCCRTHGTPRFLGDPGLPVWFIRGDDTANCVDDNISISITVDNQAQTSISSQLLSVEADLSILNPAFGVRDLTRFFSVTRYSDPIGGTLHSRSLVANNPYTWHPGRTVIQAAIQVAIHDRFRNFLPANVPFLVRSRAAAGGVPSDSSDSMLGLRRHRGQVDDGTAEAALLVQSPSQTNDLIAQRFAVNQLFPRCAGSPSPEIDVTAIQVGALSNGGAGGFDAVQLRRNDAIIPNSADPTPNGLLGGIGAIGDGLADVPVFPDPNGLCALVSVPLGHTPVRDVDDLWVTVYLSPGDSILGGTAVCADQSPNTELFESFYSEAGFQPYSPEFFSESNWIIRLVFTHSFSGFPPGLGASSEIRTVNELRIASLLPNDR